MSRSNRGQPADSLVGLDVSRASGTTSELLGGDRSPLFELDVLDANELHIPDGWLGEPVSTLSPPKPGSVISDTDAPERFELSSALGGHDNEPEVEQVIAPDAPRKLTLRNVVLVVIGFLALSVTSISWLQANRRSNQLDRSTVVTNAFHSTSATPLLTGAVSIQSPTGEVTKGSYLVDRTAKRTSLSFAADGQFGAVDTTVVGGTLFVRAPLLDALDSLVIGKWVVSPVGSAAEIRLGKLTGTGINSPSLALSVLSSPGVLVATKSGSEASAGVDQYELVVSTDKVGVDKQRQLSLLGWTQGVTVLVWIGSTDGLVRRVIYPQGAGATALTIDLAMTPTAPSPWIAPPSADVVRIESSSRIAALMSEAVR